jgi:hypothetical protein
MAPKYKSNDANNSNMPNVSLKWKDKVLDLIKKITCWGCSIHDQNKFSISEIVKKENETCMNFAVEYQPAKATAIVHGKCLVKMKNTLNLWVEGMKKWSSDWCTVPENPESTWRLQQQILRKVTPSH